MSIYIYITPSPCVLQMLENSREALRNEKNAAAAENEKLSERLYQVTDSSSDSAPRILSARRPSAAALLTLSG